MPWFPYGRRARPEENVTPETMWATLRMVQQTVGGLASEVATLALSVSRSDARLEHQGEMLTQVNATLAALLAMLQAGAFPQPPSPGWGNAGPPPRAAQPVPRWDGKQ